MQATILLLDTAAQQKLLELVFARADALNGYWNLYIAVALGLLGIMATGKPFTEERAIKLLLTAAFAVFAYSNVDAIDSTNEQRRQLLQLLSGSQYYQAALNAGPPPRIILWLFHLSLDFTAVLALWLVPWHRALVNPPSEASHE